MYRTLTFLFLLGLSLTVQAQEPVAHSQTIRFKTDKYQLTSQHRKSLDSLVASLPELSRIKVEGHTDHVGTDGYNERLSQRRTQSVVSYLQGKGIPVELINDGSWGETQPHANNATEEGRSLNRRVEVTFFTIPGEDQLLGNAEEHIDHIDDLYDQTEQDFQEFLVPADKDTAIRCEMGTVIYIKKGSFGAGGVAVSNGQVLLRVKEVLMQSQMILENVTTTAKGRMLESFGMLYTEAYAEDQEVELMDNKALKVMMPTDKIDPQAQIFSGDRETEHGLVDWELEELENWEEVQMLEYFDCVHYNIPMDRRYRWIKLRNFFRKMVGRDLLVEYKDTSKIRSWVCPELRDLYAKLDVDNIDALNMAVNQPLMDRFRVNNLPDLRKKIDKDKAAHIELAFKAGKISMADYKFYVFGQRTLGWRNVDVFKDYPRTQKVKPRIAQVPSSSVNFSMVFKQLNTAVNANSDLEQFKFDPMPRGMGAYLVGLKMKGGKPYLHLEQINIARKNYEVKWEEVTIDELKEKLKVLDS